MDSAAGSLEECATAYARALGDGRDVQDGLDLVDAVLRARIALFEYLVAAGWEPPDHVLGSLAVDRELLRQPHGALERDLRATG